MYISLFHANWQRSAAIALATECSEKAILTKADTGGIDLRFGKAEAMLQTIELIARRQGIGDFVREASASGVWGAAGAGQRWRRLGESS